MPPRNAAARPVPCRALPLALPLAPWLAWLACIAAWIAVAASHADGARAQDAPPPPSTLPPAPPPPSPPAPAPVIDAETALARARALVRPGRDGGCADPVPGEIRVCARRNTARLTAAERAAAGIGTGTDDGLTRASDASLGVAPRVGSGPFVDSRLAPNWQPIGGAVNRPVRPNAAFDQLQRVAADAEGGAGAGPAAADAGAGAAAADEGGAAAPGERP